MTVHTPIKGVLLILAGIFLTGCVPFWQKQKPPSAFAANGMPLHESWCYQTLGQTDCYTEPQDFPPDRLVNVFPPSRFPLNHQEYAKSLAESQ